MATHKIMSNYTLSDWEWKIENDKASPIWGTMPEASEACIELLRCSCKLKCTNRCKCRKKNLRCTDLRSCDAGSDE